MVHLSETCEDDTAHLITHVHTTAADVDEAMCTQDTHDALQKKELLLAVHFVDAAYVSAELLVSSRADFGIDLALLCHVTHADAGLSWCRSEDTARKSRDKARREWPGVPPAMTAAVEDPAHGMPVFFPACKALARRRCCR